MNVFTLIEFYIEIFVSKQQGFPDSRFGSFYPQNLIPDPQKLGARVLSDAYMINAKLYLYIYGFVI